MAVTVYPKNTQSLDIPFLTVVLAYDDEFQKKKRMVVEYEFSNGRKFSADPTTRWPVGAS